jgi:hypothetical protein
MKSLNIQSIRIDGATQSRVEINNAVVSEYAYAIKDGAEFPPVVVFNDGADHWLADGFHRWHAHKQAGKASIAAEVHLGSARDAVLYSLGANGTHGLNRTNADKRKAVETMLKDSEWAKWSDRKIAETCGVGHTFVSAIRKPEVAAKQQANRDTSAKKRSKVESDSTTPAKPEASPAKEEPKPEAEPAYGELDAANETIGDLQAMLAVSNLGDVSAEDKTQAANLIAELRREVKNLTLDLEAVTRSRDQLQNERAELMKQCQSYQRRLKSIDRN